MIGKEPEINKNFVINMSPEIRKENGLVSFPVSPDPPPVRVNKESCFGMHIVPVTFIVWGLLILTFVLMFIVKG